MLNEPNKPLENFKLYFEYNVSWQDYKKTLKD